MPISEDQTSNSFSHPNSASLYPTASSRPAALSLLHDLLHSTRYQVRCDVVQTELQLPFVATTFASEVLHLRVRSSQHDKYCRLSLAMRAALPAPAHASRSSHFHRRDLQGEKVARKRMISLGLQVCCFRYSLHVAEPTLAKVVLVVPCARSPSLTYRCGVFAVNSLRLVMCRTMSPLTDG